MRCNSYGSPDITLYVGLGYKIAVFDFLCVTQTQNVYPNVGYTDQAHFFKLLLMIMQRICFKLTLMAYVVISVGRPTLHW